jgi:hypothetical protein
MKKFKLPDWTKSLPGNACLSTKELADITGCSPSDVRRFMLRRGVNPFEHNYTHNKAAMKSDSRAKVKLKYRISDLRIAELQTET